MQLAIFTETDTTEIIDKHDSELMRVCKSTAMRFYEMPHILDNLAFRGTEYSRRTKREPRCMYSQRRYNVCKVIAALFHVCCYMRMQSQIAVSVIAKHCGVCDKTVYRIMDDLERAGLIWEKKREDQADLFPHDKRLNSLNIKCRVISHDLINALGLYDIWEKLKKWKQAILDDIENELRKQRTREFYKMGKRLLPAAIKQSKIDAARRNRERKAAAGIFPLPPERLKLIARAAILLGIPIADYVRKKCDESTQRRFFIDA